MLFTIQFIKNMFIGVMLLIIASNRYVMLVPATITLIVSGVYLYDAFLYCWALVRGIYTDAPNVLYIAF